MKDVRLPREVIARDIKLDSSIEKASGELMKLRWQWTLDESNPSRVGFTAYARAVGKGESTIRSYAKGFVLMRTNPDLPPSEARERAKVSVETETVTEAIASAEGLGFQTVAQTRQPVVQRVREWAREAAEREGTSIEEEAPKIAKSIARSNAGHAAHQERRDRSTYRYLTLERKLLAIRRFAVQALAEAQRLGDFDDDDVIEDLAELIAKVKATLDLIDLRISGSADIDWDAELAKLG